MGSLASSSRVSKFHWVIFSVSNIHFHSLHFLVRFFGEISQCTPKYACNYVNESIIYYYFIPVIFPVGQSSPNSNPSFQQFFFGTLSPSPSGSAQPQQQSLNPTTNYQGFSSWPFGGNGVGGFNPWQNLFGNNFQQSPNNQNANQQQVQGQPNQSPSTQPQLQNQYQTYPFGFPFANPFFPQYNQQNQYQNPASNQQPVQTQAAPNVPVANPVPNLTGQGGNPTIIGGPNINKIPSGGGNTQPVEIQVEHSKQDTKHPSLTPANAEDENMNIEGFPLNPDQQNLPPEIVDVRFEEKAKPAADGTLLFQ